MSELEDLPAKVAELADEWERDGRYEFVSAADDLRDLLTSLRGSWRGGAVGRVGWEAR